MVEAASRAEWLVVGLVLGERLPDRSLLVGDVQVMPLSDDQLSKVAPMEPRNLTLSFEDDEGAEAWHLHVSPHQVSVKSQWGFSVQIQEAENFDDAEEKAHSKIAQARQSLTIAVGSPYVFEPRRVIGPEGAASPSAAVAGMAAEVERLPPAEGAAASLYATVLETNSVCRSSAAYLDRATTLELAMIGMPEGQSGILHSYFMALEGIVADVVKEFRKELKIASADREDIIRTLEEDLNSDSSLEEKSRTIRQASNSLARLDLFHMDLQIAKAAEILGVPGDVAKVAQDFNHFRNDYLSHYRSKIPGNRIRYWFEERRALRVTTAYLRAYMHRLTTQ